MGRAVELAPGLWEVAGKPAGYPIRRNMHLYRLPGGGLLVLGAMLLPDFGWEDIEALGTPEVVHVASPYHTGTEGAFPGRYPSCRLVAPAGSLEAVRKEFPGAIAAQEVLPDLGIAIQAPDGVRPAEIPLALPVEGGTALWFGDMLFNLPVEPGLGGLITRLIGSSGFLGMTRIGKAAFLLDRAAFRGWLERMAGAESLALLLFAHGDAVPGHEAAGAGLAAAAGRLA